MISEMNFNRHIDHIILWISLIILLVDRREGAV